jgi:hypothetical protein
MAHVIELAELKLLQQKGESVQVFSTVKKRIEMNIKRTKAPHQQRH